MVETITSEVSKVANKVTEQVTSIAETVSTANKAIIGGLAIGAQDINTVLYGLTGYLGIGTMPPEIELQRAIVGILYAIGGAFIIYIVPNYYTTFKEKFKV